MLVLSGCGDLGPAELDRGIQTLTALTAEGELLARAVRDDRTKASYARVHARDLADDAQHEAEKLADAGTSPDTRAWRDRAVAAADSLSDTLGTIETFPGGERAAVGVLEQLDALSQDLDDLHTEIR
ncbi:MAG: hypothetical protein QOH46_539 [Solirubrobacteraceae bacterium]|jgi:hypothetical protein|nr:hypothetical protein [Solirubrobacteraceae bacterium]